VTASLRRMLEKNRLRSYREVALEPLPSYNLRKSVSGTKNRVNLQPHLLLLYHIVFGELLLTKKPYYRLLTC
jgi:hypothetical protein